MLRTVRATICVTSAYSSTECPAHMSLLTDLPQSAAPPRCPARVVLQWPAVRTGEGAWTPAPRPGTSQPASEPQLPFRARREEAARRVTSYVASSREMGQEPHVLRPVEGPPLQWVPKASHRGGPPAPSPRRAVVTQLRSEPPDFNCAQVLLFALSFSFRINVKRKTYPLLEAILAAELSGKKTHPVLPEAAASPAMHHCL